MIHTLHFSVPPHKDGVGIVEGLFFFLSICFKDIYSHTNEIINSKHSSLVNVDSVITIFQTLC